MTDFTTTIAIAAPADQVWQVMSDVDRWHEWTPSITSIKRLGNGAFAVGARLVIRQPKFPPALWTLAEIEPGRSFTWVSRAPGMTVIGKHAVEPAGQGSRATLSLRYEGLVGRAFARMTRGITERYIGYEASGLKARSEDPAYRHPGL